MTAVSPYAPSNLILGDLNDLGHVLIECTRAGLAAFRKESSSKHFRCGLFVHSLVVRRSGEKIKIKGKVGNGRGTGADVFCERTASPKTTFLH